MGRRHQRVELAAQFAQLAVGGARLSDVATGAAPNRQLLLLAAAQQVALPAGVAVPNDAPSKIT